MPKAQKDCDAWGMRKFMSHFVKRLSQTTRPKDSSWQVSMRTNFNCILYFAKLRILVAAASSEYCLNNGFLNEYMSWMIQPMMSLMMKRSQSVLCSLKCACKVHIPEYSIYRRTVIIACRSKRRSQTMTSPTSQRTSRQRRVIKEYGILLHACEVFEYA